MDITVMINELKKQEAITTTLDVCEFLNLRDEFCLKNAFETLTCGFFERHPNEDLIIWSVKLVPNIKPEEEISTAQYIITYFEENDWEAIKQCMRKNL